MVRLLLGIALACLALAPDGLWAAEAGGKSVIEWVFDKPGDLKGWVGQSHLKNVRVEDGALQGEAADWDPFLVSPVFDIAATPWQYVEIRMKCNKPGQGQLFYSNTLDTPYNGFLPAKHTNFDIPGGDEWQTVRIQPFWHAEKKIIHIRIDFHKEAVFAIQSVRVVEPAGDARGEAALAWDFSRGAAGWTPVSGVTAPTRSGKGIAVEVTEKGGLLRSPVLRTPLEKRVWVAVRMRSQQGTRASLVWASDTSSGLQSLTFPIRSDGRFHTYNVDVGMNAQWDGTLLSLGLRPSHTPGDRVEIEFVRLEEDALGEPDLELVHFGMEDAINRVGKPSRLTASFANQGAKTAAGVKATLTLPAGVTARPDPARGGDKPEFEFQLPGAFRWTLTASKPVEGQATLRISGPGAPAQTFTAPIRITQGPKLPKARVVPPPKPAPTKYQIGTYYFPGWNTAAKWECIERVAPIRKPVLGYYDEANPEVVDWQIKWAVEHGITFFLVDWYWSAGGRHLEHWLHDGYMKSRYRKDLQWCVMWANHNAAGSHSVEDWRKVTQYWIDNYFGMEEYLRIDGKPAVFIWAPYNIRRDVGGAEESAKLYAMSQEMAKKAGYPGITFAAMNAGKSPNDTKLLASEGYTHNTSYHWWGDAPQKAADSRYFPFSLVAESSRPAWDTWAKAAQEGGTKFIPVADTGWDSRPWHGDKAMVIHGLTPPLFEKVLRDAKNYLDERKETMLILGPCNEWGEGSYIEPCVEYGFGMYDAVRNVFCEGPREHLDIAPVDVGLGPYDFPVTPQVARTAWTFDTPGDTQGWGSSMGLSTAEARDGALHARTRHNDPAFGIAGLRIRASQFPFVTIRLKASAADGKQENLQLFWGGANRSHSEAASVRVPMTFDGEWHTYVLPVGENPRWRGIIQSFRLDPGSTSGVDIWIDEIRLTTGKPE